MHACEIPPPTSPLRCLCCHLLYASLRSSWSIVYGSTAIQIRSKLSRARPSPLSHIVFPSSCALSTGIPSDVIPRNDDVALYIRDLSASLLHASCTDCLSEMVKGGAGSICGIICISNAYVARLSPHTLNLSGIVSLLSTFSSCFDGLSRVLF